ncbi:hypothetical protein PAHAL_5G387600 [Panicum hallii]|jgi:hypothetical protein|uniref:Uncharacterized protein n=1 Tax=Panicum hallii TaxID=206008 RepID=A0A2T8IML3_9POAL|nr:hypothetical protein PAHAL_5G387600 [Panicum hallii]
MTTSDSYLIRVRQRWFLFVDNCGNSIVADHLDPGAIGSGFPMSGGPQGITGCIANAAGPVPSSASVNCLCHGLMASFRRHHCREGDTDVISENKISSTYVVLFSELCQRAIQICCSQMFDGIPFQMLSEMQIVIVLLSYIQSIFEPFLDVPSRCHSNSSGHFFPICAYQGIRPTLMLAAYIPTN